MGLFSFSSLTIASLTVNIYQTSLSVANTIMCFTVMNIFPLCSLAWAERRGYKTAKAARNDVYRAANSLLRLAVDGRLCLCLRPTGYSCLRGRRLLCILKVDGR